MFIKFMTEINEGVIESEEDKVFIYIYMYIHTHSAGKGGSYLLLWYKCLNYSVGG